MTETEIQKLQTEIKELKQEISEAKGDMFSFTKEITKLQNQIQEITKYLNFHTHPFIMESGIGRYREDLLEEAIKQQQQRQQQQRPQPTPENAEE
ncbi:MAG: hypothetical protein GF411_02985 [Candidatus Lokiarchaeota archaeon]|nr:hypothetical protein [Candidatus Lokiarchaeota archaeon]